MTEEQVAKLPKWAKQHIETITQQRDAAVKQLNEFLDTQTESSIYIEEFSTHVSPPIFVKKFIQGDQVTFGSISVRLETNDEKTRLYISDKRDAISIEPHSSNSFYLTTKKRWE